MSESVSIKAPELIDGALDKRVLVYGSLPPHGRDLDLLVRSEEKAAIQAVLSQAGFLGRDSALARFGSCSVEVVELASAPDWNLPAPELQALYDEARELEGCQMLVRPAPHHALLILARRLAGAGGALDQKRRERLEEALAEDPQAWSKAKQRAKQWGARLAIELLQRSHENQSPASPRLYARARRERRSLQGGPSPRRLAKRALDKLERIPRLRGGTVVSFSGLDGSGKSSQAAALCETLNLLGIDAVVVRTRISWEDWLWAAVPHAKRLLEPCVRLISALSSIPRRTLGSPPESVNTPQPAGSAATNAAQELRRPDAAGGDPVRGLRERSAALTEFWILIIALANAWSQWRLMYRQFFRGATIVCDRYTLDSIVEMRYSYGKEKALPRLRRMLTILYPRPVRAYFLDVQPDTALRRKGEWGLQWLSEHRELYLQECEALGVSVLDGERPQEDLCAAIAGEVWLGQQDDRSWPKRVRRTLRALLPCKQGS